MITQYKLSLKSKPEGTAGRSPRPRGKLQYLRASILTLLAISAIIGILMAALVIGSVVASLLLVLLALSTIFWLIRRLFLKFARRRGNV